MYREAKRQNIILKTELETKTEQWREWHEWWEIQKQTFIVKSASPAKQSNHPPQESEPEIEPQDNKADKDIADQQDVMLGKDNAEAMIEDEYFRTTFSPDAVAARRDTQSIVSPEIPSIKSRTSIKRTTSSEQVPTSESNVVNNNMEEIREIYDILQSAELEDVLKTSKPSEAIEILEVPESPISNPRSTSLSNETRAIIVEPLSRPKPSPTRPRALNSSTPLSTRTSGKKSKKRGYPNMIIFTEDGTDGINPHPPSPVEPDDGGLLTAMLEGPPPEAIPISLPPRKSSPTTTPPMKTEPTVKSGQVRQVIEIESDSESGEISTPIERAQKRQKVESEPRLRRRFLSPDLALRNKGRGRYSTSCVQRCYSLLFCI